MHRLQAWLTRAVQILERLASNVRRLRKEKGWSQERYAFEAEVHRTYVSEIERAKRNPTATVIEKLAKPLGIAPGRLLD
jgi:transcriptional regulator with XRE-family HTH domain